MIAAKEWLMETPLATTWPEAEQVPLLTGNEAQVWAADLRQPAGMLDRFWSFLTEDERRRAESFRVDLHRNRFIAGRGMLRALLASYLDRAPGQVELAYGPAGKPALRAQDELEFNAAHSGDLALFAFSRDPVGVDLEEVRMTPEYGQIARSHFAPGECARLEALPEQERPLAFLRCWTRKEAFLKTSGEGITAGLKTFEVSFEPGVETAVLQGGLERASLHHLEPAAGYIGALHILDPHPRLRCFRFTASVI